MYERFRSILACNDSTLQLIADIEDRLSGRYPFSLNLIVRRIRRSITDVFVMVRDFDELTSGKHPELFDSVRGINTMFESDLAGFTITSSGPLVKRLSELRSSDALVAGSKMANLGEIKNVIGLNVPDGFVITTAAFVRFMEDENLIQRAEKLEGLTETFGQRVLSEACRELQQQIIDAPMPAELEEAIRTAYRNLSAGEPTLVAMRSSSVGEDREASHAGLYYTELNVGEGWLLDAYRWVLASSYGAGPMQYRLKHGLTNIDATMAAGCLRMIEPKCNGIMFSRSFHDKEADKIVISAYPGLADAGLVGGTTSEDITVSAGRIELGESSCCLSEADVMQLADAARRLEKHFGGPQDIEWAIDKEGRLFILQSRPMVFVEREPHMDAPQVGIDKSPILSGGSTACPGIGSGPVFVVRNDGDLDRFPEKAVLVSRHSSPRFSLVMNRCAAIVTDEGSPIGHMSILAREYHIPTIVGLKSSTAVLHEGREVTIDATNCRIYDGLLPEAATVEPSAPLANSPAVQKLVRIARSITPLQLIDTASPAFTPSNCRSLHDITRYVHEKVFEVMFYVGDKAATLSPDSLSLEEDLPFRVLVLDVGGGIADGSGSEGRISLGDVASVPMKAFLSGLSDKRVNWKKPRAVSARGFMSVLGENIAGPPAEALGVGQPSFAVISDRYMNFSTKAGYHFNTVDTYCGKSLNKNYIHFRFEGGAADEARRERRCKFISIVLNSLNFKVQVRGDVLVGRLEKYDRELIQQRLVDLGRLTLSCRQLDMLMRDEASPDFFARAFLAGELERF
jgi:pyruvate,water dikinase